MVRTVLTLAAILAACPGCGSRTSYTPPEHPDRKHERRLQPAIAFVDGFLAGHGRLPNDEEFRAWNEEHGGMFVLLDRTDGYAASKGATGQSDYMVGTWRADWYHYYKSWDGTFLNGCDQDLRNGR